MKRLILTVFSIFILFFFCGALSPDAVYARSAFSPRHTGLEPPGGPKQPDMMPGHGISRTPMGGMGYTDAYGNTIDDQVPEEKKARKRLRHGAYGAKEKQAPVAPLPDPGNTGKPLWSFQ